MNGKQKCRILKEIRRQIAEQNDIDLVIAECTHKGECRGTCPRCEAEVRYLERELEKRRQLQKRVALAGISAGMSLALSGCAVVETLARTAAPQVVVEPVDAPDDLMGMMNIDDQTKQEDQLELDGDVALIDPVEDDSWRTTGELLPPDECDVVETTEGEVAPFDWFEGAEGD